MRSGYGYGYGLPFGGRPNPAPPPLNSSDDLRFLMVPALATVVAGGAQSLVDQSKFASVWTAPSSGQRPVVGTDSVGTYLQMVPANDSRLLTTDGGLRAPDEDHGLIAYVDIADGQVDVQTFLLFGDPVATQESAIGNFGGFYYSEINGNAGNAFSATPTSGRVVFESYAIAGGLFQFVDGQPALVDGFNPYAQNVAGGSGLADRHGHTTPTGCKVYRAYGISGASVISGGAIVFGPGGMRWKALDDLRKAVPAATKATQVAFFGHSQIAGGLLNDPTETPGAYTKSWLLSDHSIPILQYSLGNPGAQIEELLALITAQIGPVRNPLSVVGALVIWAGINDYLQLQETIAPDFANPDHCVARCLSQIESMVTAAREAGYGGPIVVCTEPRCVTLDAFPEGDGARTRVNAGIRAMGGIHAYDIDAALSNAGAYPPGLATTYYIDGLHLTAVGYSLVGRGISTLLSAIIA